MLCYVMLCYVMLCYVMLCYVMLCYVMLCHVMLCYVMLSLLCFLIFIAMNFRIVKLNRVYYGVIEFDRVKATGKFSTSVDSLVS